VRVKERRRPQHVFETVELTVLSSVLGLELLCWQVRLAVTMPDAVEECALFARPAFLRRVVPTHGGKEWTLMLMKLGKSYPGCEDIEEGWNIFRRPPATSISSCQCFLRVLDGSDEEEESIFCLQWRLGKCLGRSLSSQRLSPRDQRRDLHPRHTKHLFQDIE
jgi:hypothetical protein